jgi:choline-sulfatase
LRESVTVHLEQTNVQPNILIIMVDQLNGTLFPDGPARFLHAPNLARLAERAVRFNANYCASPLCAPSRASFMSGQLPSRTGVYDNAAEFPSCAPTFAHHLRRLGYRTVLSGKMHFVGPDQLHGFEERLTTDIYPADFGWTPDWTRPEERIDWWYHNLSSVTDAGVAEMTNQLEYDDEVAHFARQQLFDFARKGDGRPFCLAVSFTHPHDPYVMRQRFWDLYEGVDLPMPGAAIPYEAQDPHSRRILDSCDWRRFAIGEEHIRAARRAYFAAISYLDETIGSLLETLATCGFADNTIVVFTSDHGDMLGERGLWFKMSFFEGGARVPLLIAAPGWKPRGVAEPTSLLDVLPTVVELAGGSVAEIATPLDGQSLVPLASGAAISGRRVLAEYAAEGAVAPIVMIREGTHKYIFCESDPPLLFDLANDPDERANLAANASAAGSAERFATAVLERWDLAAFNTDVLASQARRRLVYEALRNGAYYPWDFQPLQKASERYMRNHMDLNKLEASARFPPAQPR